MSSWRDQILKEFTPQVARLTLVADPDGLLLEEGVLEGIRERGFELIPFDDHVAFRYAYESRFRSRWDHGEETDLVVVLRSPSSDLAALPYDLLQAGRQLSFNLGDLFPNLSYPVLAALDRADLDALYEAQTRYAPGPLGDNATKEFVLRHVFEIAPELIRKPSDLLKVLLRRHYRRQRIPAILDERLIQVLRLSGLFDDWPLERIVPDREAFFAFLQERWPAFLDRWVAREDAFHEDTPGYGLEFSGPTDLPFDHDDVRVYLDNLFFDGILQPVPHPSAESLAKSWVSMGIVHSKTLDRRRRIKGLLDSVENTIPQNDARHSDWFSFAYRWAELVALGLESDDETPEGEEDRQRVETLRPQIDSALATWVLKRYAGLISLPPIPPAMLHHIPRFLVRSLMDDPRAKVAFLLVDGLSLDQWVILRTVLGEQDARLRFHESAVFAWIPTITSVSRQAAFAGKPPLYFPASIYITDKEPVLWTQFWVDQGLKQHEVAYAKGPGDLSAGQAGGDLDRISELLADTRLRVVGLVVDKVDKIMHGMELGTAGMHNQVRQWARQGFLRHLLELLLDRGFLVYLASDHGNIEATGCGRPAEGAVADLRGERVRVYSDPQLRGEVKKRFPNALEWPPLGLPVDYLPLVAPDRAAFVREAERLVGHGGISVEELLVPFIQIDRRDR
ncbi:BREX-3 system phosphatase PglZ [Dissulfurimicrobium hydrothermale]|uniref:BREX-3 system phosphatase PglZ n=1 Tax=Dissulfurimicrobium hydrothermale TaxID=1750598 RepID=UPI001EDB349B|nr:BREX-3 system phosphatase PglZ [Dissulfurimicrobium hydrothermale]UKL13964.1 BREX-3 system phosphatase PglZ [Dissulfurimicrobium hydrothermale]